MFKIQERIQYPTQDTKKPWRTMILNWSIKVQSPVRLVALLAATFSVIWISNKKKFKINKNNCRIPTSSVKWERIRKRKNTTLNSNKLVEYENQIFRKCH